MKFVIEMASIAIMQEADGPRSVTMCERCNFPSELCNECIAYCHYFYELYNS
jgi:hypothetical protein